MAASHASHDELSDNTIRSSNVGTKLPDPRPWRQVDHGLHGPTDEARTAAAEAVPDARAVEDIIGGRPATDVELGTAFTEEDGRAQFEEIMNDETREDATYEGVDLDLLVYSEAEVSFTEAFANAPDVDRGQSAVQQRQDASVREYATLSLADAVLELKRLRDEMELCDPRHPNSMGLQSMMSLLVEQVMRLVYRHALPFNLNGRHPTTRIPRDPPAVFTATKIVRDVFAELGTGSLTTAAAAAARLSQCLAELTPIATYTPAQKPVVRRLAAYIKSLRGVFWTGCELEPRHYILIGDADFLAVALQLSSLLCCPPAAHAQQTSHPIVARLWEGNASRPS